MGEGVGKGVGEGVERGGEVKGGENPIINIASLLSGVLMANVVENCDWTISSDLFVLYKLSVQPPDLRICPCTSSLICVVSLIYSV